MSYTANNQVNSDHVRTQINNFNAAVDSKLQKQFPFMFGVPNCVSSFCGREQEVVALDRLFNKDKIVAVHGLGGYGKTQLALHYAELRREKYCESLVLIRGETKEHLISSFRAVALDIQIPNCKDRDIKSVVLEVYNYFERTGVLFIIDNAQDKKSILEFLPQSFKLKDAVINVLITSQCTSWGDTSSLPLKELSLEHALQVLSVIISEDYFSNIPRDEWKQLAETFCCIPLGLHIAAGYVKQRLTSSVNNDFSVVRYITRIQEKDLLFDKKLPSDSDSTYEKSIYRSLYFTVEKIESSDDEESKWAMNLINVCAYLNPDDITVELLLKLHVIGDSVDNLEEALYILEKYSLIMDKEKKTRKWTKNHFTVIRIHRLVQMFFRYHQEKSQTVPLFYKNALYTVTCMSNFSFYEQCVHVLKYTNCLKILLESLTLPEAKSMIEDMKLLHVASKTVLPDVMRLLLQHGAEVNSVSTTLGLEGSPLLLLTENFYSVKNIERSKLKAAVRCLLEYNTNIADRDPLDSTLLHYAARWKCPALIVEILNKRQLDVNVQNWENCTPLHWISRDEIFDEAELIRAKECIQVLVDRKADVNATNCNGQSVLHYTAMYANWPLTQFLIDTFGMDSNMQDHKENTPLLLSNTRVTINNEEDIQRAKRTVEVLMKRRALLNVKNVDGAGILHLVACKCVPLIKYLISNYSVQINTRDKRGWMPLHYLARVQVSNEAEMDRIKEMVRVLVQRGADINATTFDKVPVVSLASSAYNLRLIEYLLEKHRVRVNQLDSKRKTPLLWALEKKVHDDSDQERLEATVKLLISKNANPREIYRHRTVLHYCALALNPQLLEFFIDQHGLCPNVQDKNGFTALHVIADADIWNEKLKKSAINCIDVLRSRGARVDLLNKNDLTAAQYAEHSPYSYLVPFLE